MTFFEYVAVAISIVLSFSAVRLIEALPQIAVRGRRDFTHSLWVANLLALHAHFWWIFWSYHEVSHWTYPQFLFALAAPGLLYSMSNTLVSGSPAVVVSWAEHFSCVRQRFFVLWILFVVALGFLGWLVRGIPLWHPLRALQLATVVTAAAGACWDRPAFQRALAVWFSAMFLLLALVLGFARNPLAAPGG